MRHGILSEKNVLTVEFRRDLVAMLCVVEPEGISSHCDLYLGFLQVMSLQVTSMDRDLLQVRPRFSSMETRRT
jgi:hypothetical protein